MKSIDSLTVVVDHVSKDSDRIKHYIALCSIYKNNSIKLNSCNEKLLASLKETNDTKEIGHYYLNKSFVYYNQRKFKQSLLSASRAKNLFIKQNNTLQYLHAVMQTAECYVQLSENENAKRILKNNLKLAFSKNNILISNFYTKIGNSYIYQDSIYHGLSYYKKAIPYLSKKSSQENALFFERCSTLSKILGHNKSALHYINLAIKNSKRDNLFLFEAKKASLLNLTDSYQEALKLSLKNYSTILIKKKSHLWQYNLILYNIAYSYYHLKKYDASQYYIKKVLDKKNTITDKKVECFILLSNVYLDLNKKELARNYIDKALTYRDSIYPNHPSIELYNQAARIEEDAGNFKKALFYYKKKTIFEINNLTKLNNEKVFELQTDFNVAIKDTHIAVLEQEKKSDLKEKTKQNENLLVVSVALLFAFLFLMFYVKNYRTVKTKNILIENEKLLVKKSLLEKETLLKEIHHRVKNNMQLVISLLKIQARDSKELSIENFIEVSENRIRSMALIHEYLYESENINYVNFKEYVNRLSSSIRGSFSNQSTIKLETQINNTHFNIETAIPLGLIINELVINAFKHAFIGKEQGIIKIILFNEQDLHHLEVTDNGIGIDTIQENGPSIGLKIVKLLVSQINGQMQIKKNSGTQFTIQFKDINSTHE